MDFLVFPPPSCYMTFAVASWQQQQTGLADPDFVYPMHFTRYSLQWRLLNFKMKYSRLLLNDSTGGSTGDEQQPRIWARFEYYT